jgi:hypothetical protein
MTYLEATMAVGEWDTRQLCADGGCVGLIGPDGTCKACGRAAPNWGDERKRGLIEPADSDPDDDAGPDAPDEPAHDAGVAAKGYDRDDDDDDGELDDDDSYDDDGYDDADADDDAAAVTEPAAVASPNEEWASRELCSDGTCIGVIGADGICKVCGRDPAPASGLGAVAGEPASGADPADDPPSGCSQPGCAGVRGPDRGCTVCGAVLG